MLAKNEAKKDAKNDAGSEAGSGTKVSKSEKTSQKTSSKAGLRLLGRNAKIGLIINSSQSRMLERKRRKHGGMFERKSGKHGGKHSVMLERKSGKHSVMLGRKSGKRSRGCSTSYCLGCLYSSSKLSAVSKINQSSEEISSEKSIAENNYKHSF